MSIAEALMCGVPCIVCNVGGCADLVRDGVEGFVIEPRRADLIFDRMDRMARMGEEEFQGFQRRARARYEEVCLPAKVGAVVAEHYRAVMGR
jgi:glycosyltransferase involved in cell wall biosynthesis